MARANAGAPFLEYRGCPGAFAPPEAASIRAAIGVRCAEEVGPTAETDARRPERSGRVSDHARAIGARRWTDRLRLRSDARVLVPLSDRSRAPITGDAIQPSTATVALANPINGHEFLIPVRNELQFTCIFPLPTPRDCSLAGTECDCTSAVVSQNKPLCQNPTTGAYGTTQYFAKAYPGTRHLQLLGSIGTQAVATSICPRNLSDSTRSDYAYRPAVQAMIERLRVTVK